MSRPEKPGPVGTEFTEPWQAEALALSIALQDSGHITPAEWSDALNGEIEKARAAGDPADGTTYYQHVVGALERLVANKGLLGAAALDERRRDWGEAYRRTPHGHPVVLTKPAAEGER
ncbi:nitrile hydratase accessory protein [Beijerinckia mobilis]|uniref:nitrile hydratase accessory protein n=1 Tax=Beijerinckia mobilis TaxID=231434 RepID=UPI0005544A28|nr:nitrile hydratase accessory protein [Beijerinckia mobilis]